MDPRTYVQLAEAKKTAALSALLAEKESEVATNSPRIKVWYGKLLLTIAWFMVFCANLVADDARPQFILVPTVVCQEKAQLEDFLTKVPKTEKQSQPPPEVEGCVITDVDLIVRLNRVIGPYNDGTVKAVIFNVDTDDGPKYTPIGFEIIEGQEA